MNHYNNKPLYSIGIAANILEICTTTLRIWEKKGLIKPSRIGKNRFYSNCDMEKLKMVKDLIQKKNINIEGVKALLKIKPCWEIKNCAPNIRDNCDAYLKK